MRLKWQEVYVWGSGHPLWCYVLTHLRVCAQFYLPDLSGLEVVRPISHFPSSRCPHRHTFYPQHSHNVMGRRLSVYKLTTSLSEWWHFKIPSPLRSAQVSANVSHDYTLKVSCHPVVMHKVPGQAVISGKHQGWGDMRTATRPHPKTGNISVYIIHSATIRLLLWMPLFRSFNHSDGYLEGTTGVGKLLDFWVLKMWQEFKQTNEVLRWPTS